VICPLRIIQGARRKNVAPPSRPSGNAIEAGLARAAIQALSHVAGFADRRAMLRGGRGCSADLRG
jgi:hypothetical protein